MNEDDFYLDEDAEDSEDIYYGNQDESSGGNDDDDGTFEGESSDDVKERKDYSLYDGKLTTYKNGELDLIRLYDDISSQQFDIDDAVMIIVGVDPKNTNEKTINDISKEILHLQGHARIRATNVNPSNLVRGSEINEELERDEDTDLNEEYTETMKRLIAGFVEYLATRDLSQDSTVSRTRKQRMLPAFIIYLFSSGSYDFITNCPTMPKVYNDMINRAFEGLKKSQNEILEELIKAFEEAGRDKVAEKIRQEGLSWFIHEPAQILDLADYRYLELTKSDVAIYKKYRTKYINVSASITQDVISKYIEVEIDAKKGIYKPLKDKTRTEAINDVKKEFIEWSREHSDTSDNLVSKLIYKKELEAE